MRTDTRRHVRITIHTFVRTIEDGTGHLTFGLIVISNSNPDKLAAQEEFSIGGPQFIPTEATKNMTGVRHPRRSRRASAITRTSSSSATARPIYLPSLNERRLT